MRQNQCQTSKINVKFSNILLGLGSGVFACGAAALSLGDARGTVVLGRPIDLVFDVLTDSGTDLDAACITATAVAGETRIDSSRLRIVAQPVVAGRPPSVRIRSSVAVMEPILSVELAVGCSGVVSRTYHFFADLPAGVSSGALPVLIAPVAAPSGTSEDVAVQQRPGAAAGAAAPLQSARVPSAAADPAPARQPKQRQQPPADAPAPLGVATPPAKLPRKAVVPAAPAAPAAPAVQPRSRLVVEPLAQGLNESAPLRLPPSLQAVPAQTPTAQRAQVDALGQALNTAAEGLQQASKRLQQQQADIVATRASNAKMQAALSDLQQRMERLDRERFSSTLVYGLLGLLAVALALLGWLWMRTQSSWQRSGPAWNHSEILPPIDSIDPVDPVDPVDPIDDLSERPAHPAEPSSVLAPLAPDEAPVLPDAAVLPVVPAAAAWMPESAPAAVSPAPLLAPVVRVVNPEDLFDLQQQAEFFMSVGEHDQAIEVMKKHIAENEKTSPSMYLELLRLYRALSRIEDFNHLRAQFHQYFNAQVPEFSVFHGANRTLFDYPESLAPIEAVWNDVSVLPLLESYIFCSSNSNVDGRFELPAYDDLLMLYAIASTTPASARGAPSLRQRTTPRAAKALQNPVLQTSFPLSKDMDMGLNKDMDMDMALDMGTDSGRPLQSDTGAVQAPPVDDNLMEYDDFLLPDSAALDDVPLPGHRTAVSDWTLDIDLNESSSDFGEALPQITRSDDFAAPTLAPAAQPPVVAGAHSDSFDVLFDLDFEARDPDRR